MAPPRTRSTDDPAGQTSQVEDSATVAAVDEPTAEVAASEPTSDAPAETVTEETPADTAGEQPVAPADPPVGRPPLSEVAEQAARGAFPTDAQEG